MSASILFYGARRREAFGPLANEAGGPPLIGYPQLLIQRFRSSISGDIVVHHHYKYSYLSFTLQTYGEFYTHTHM
jgi:hypothetical protein